MLEKQAYMALVNVTVRCFGLHASGSKQSQSKVTSGLLGMLIAVGHSVNLLHSHDLHAALTVVHACPK